MNIKSFLDGANYIPGFDGRPLIAGTLHFYEPGTGFATRKPTYPTAADAIAGTNINPVGNDDPEEPQFMTNNRGRPSNSAGTAEVQIWLRGDYDAVIKDSEGQVVGQFFGVNPDLSAPASPGGGTIDTDTAEDWYFDLGAYGSYDSVLGVYGKHALQLKTGAKASTYSYTGESGLLTPVAPGDLVALHVRARALNTDDAGAVNARFFTFDGTVIAEDMAEKVEVFAVAPTVPTEFEAFRGTVTVPAGARFMALELHGGDSAALGSGIDFDDVRLTRIAPGNIRDDVPGVQTILGSLTAPSGVNIVMPLPAGVDTADTPDKWPKANGSFFVDGIAQVENVPGGEGNLWSIEQAFFTDGEINRYVQTWTRQATVVRRFTRYGTDADGWQAFQRLAVSGEIGVEGLRLGHVTKSVGLTSSGGTGGISFSRPSDIPDGAYVLGVMPRFPIGTQLQNVNAYITSLGTPAAGGVTVGGVNMMAGSTTLYCTVTYIMAE